MRFLTLDDMPTNQDVFESDKFILKAVGRHVRSQYPTALLLITGNEVRFALRNIGISRAESIRRLLDAHGLRHRDFTESTRQVLINLFGSVEDAPISSLQMMTSTADGFTNTKLWPLDIIAKLEQIEPKMMIGDVVSMSSRDVAAMISKRFSYDEAQLRTRTGELNERLHGWQLSLKPARLRAVS